jgi:pimeloyl-ACP methyl ester carboxylesterase
VGSRPSVRRTRALLFAAALTVVACEADDQVDGAGPELRPDDTCFDLEVVGAGPDEDDGITCGHVEVPLHHDDPQGATIEVAVVTYPGTASADHDRPLVVLGGGPGENMLEPFLTEPWFRDLFDVGPDLIVVDQRGVGSSRPALDCPEPSNDVEEGVTADEELDAYIAGLLDCRERLADEGIDLAGFNHLANAADIDLVRQALDHDEIDVRGTSYGTQVALLAAQMQPETIGALLLSSPVDPTRNWVELAPAGIQRALDEVAEACEQDQECSAGFGALDALIDSTLDRLDDEPEQIDVELPEIGSTTVTFTPAQFLGALSLLFYLPDGVTTLPAMAAAAADGDLSPLAELSVTLEQQLVGALSVGMQYSMLCTGEGALVTEASLREATDGGPIEEYWIEANVVAGDRLPEVCDQWDVATIYDPDEVAIDHDVPTLIVTGEFDHVTPPQLGESVAAGLGDHVLIEVPAAGHAPLEVLGPCGQQIAGEFLRDPSTPPDDRCATAREVAFLVGPGSAAS